MITEIQSLLDETTRWLKGKTVLRQVDTGATVTAWGNARYVIY